MTNQTTAYFGNILYSEDKDTLISREKSYVLVENGAIVSVVSALPEGFPSGNIIDWGDNLIIPGFCDMHTHPPQFSQRGVGMDQELLTWLNTYTFPNEAKFQDAEHAKRIYALFANELIKQGTLHVNCFPTLHYEASAILFDVLADKGIFAFTGKLNMDQNSPDYYIENTAHSIAETERFMEEHQHRGNVHASIVPRFTINCSEPLLAGLGALAVKYNAPVHSHMCEAINEMKVCKELFPQYKNGAEIFNKNNLLGQTPTMMAHCIFMDDDVLELMQNPNCMAVHCPDATANINAGGIMPVKKLLQMGINLAIGSDIGSCESLSIARGVATTIQHSKIRAMYCPEWDAVTFAEAFYMATLSGGRYFGKTGSLAQGYHFNALVIDDSNLYTDGLSPMERLERFCYLGDDRNIRMRYLLGNEVSVDE